LEKAGLAPAFSFAPPVRRIIPPHPQQTVDGVQGALEIRARSSYVLNAPIGVRSRFSGDARPNAARLTRLELPVWMK
jgi:hypothetical protein